MRVLYDSTTAADLPDTAGMVAGYVDGLYRWSDADWARFPRAVKVRIAVFATTDDGHVLDVEKGNATPGQAPGWVAMRRRAGADPTVYCARANWAALRSAFTTAGVPAPHWWVADWTNSPHIPAGAVACQWADPPLTGHHWDISEVADVWPGVDTTGDDVTLTPDEAAQLANAARFAAAADDRAQALQGQVTALGKSVAAVAAQLTDLAGKITQGAAGTPVVTPTDVPLSGTLHIGGTGAPGAA